MLNDFLRVIYDGMKMVCELRWNGGYSGEM